MSLTASNFRDPVLRVLGTQTGLIPGRVVPLRGVLPDVYALMGVAENDHGTDNHGHPKVRLWAQQAFNKILRKQKLGEKAGRGQWSLTPEGVSVAALLLGQSIPTPPVPEEDEIPEKDEIPEEADFEDLYTLLDSMTGDLLPEIATPILETDMETEGGVSWSPGPQTDTYNTDPYIRGIAIASTACFSNFSERSTICGDCSLSGACKGAMISNLAAVAARLQKRDDEAVKINTVTTPESNSDLSIDDILDAIESVEEEEIPKPEVVDPNKVRRMSTPADAKCRKCSAKIARGTPGVFVRDTGMFHESCYNEGI